MSGKGMAAPSERPEEKSGWSHPARRASSVLFQFLFLSATQRHQQRLPLRVSPCADGACERVRTRRLARRPWLAAQPCDMEWVWDPSE